MTWRKDLRIGNEFLGNSAWLMRMGIGGLISRSQSYLTFIGVFTSGVVLILSIWFLWRWLFGGRREKKERVVTQQEIRERRLERLAQTDLHSDSGSSQTKTESLPRSERKREEKKGGNTTPQSERERRLEKLDQLQRNVPRIEKKEPPKSSSSGTEKRQEITKEQRTHLAISHIFDVSLTPHNTRFFLPTLAQEMEKEGKSLYFTPSSIDAILPERLTKREKNQKNAISYLLRSYKRAQQSVTPHTPFLCFPHFFSERLMMKRVRSHLAVVLLTLDLQFNKA